MPCASPKNLLVASLLCFFCGVLGIHRFCVGKVGTGIPQLVTVVVPGLVVSRLRRPAARRLWPVAPLVVPLRGRAMRPTVPDELFRAEYTEGSAVADLPVVAVMALALLHEEPMHPYEIFRTLEHRCETRLARITAGSVYHAVERLVADGLAEVVGAEREGNRPERTTYRATQAGTQALLPRLTSLLADDHRTYPPFAVGLAEAPHLPKAAAVAALAARRDRLAAASAWSATTLTQLREERGLPLRFVLDRDHEAAVLAAEVAWLDDIIRRLEADPDPWESDQVLSGAARVSAVPHPAP